MMRGPKSWAVAVRKPNDEIVVQSHELPSYPQRHGWTRRPFLRGVWVLFESLAIGAKALKISAAYSMEEEDAAAGDVDAAEKALNYTLGIGLPVILAAFIVIPAFISKWGGNQLGISGDVAHNLAEGAIRIGFFLAYILLISLIPDIRRVFQYHGAEHKTIYAYENDDPMDPEVIDTYSTLHVRCGTNFLFIVMAVSVVGHLLVDVALLGSPLAVKLGARVLMIPLVAGTAYEVIRAAGKNEHSVIFKAASLPGLALQKITTRPPTHDQIEVAIKAMEGVIERIEAAEKVDVYEVQPAEAGEHLGREPGIEPA